MLLLISGMLPASAVRLSVVILGPSAIRMPSVPSSRLIAGVARRLRFPTSAVRCVLAVVTLRICSSGVAAAAAVVIVAIVPVLLALLMRRVVVGRMRLIVFGLRTASPRMSFAVVITAGCIRWTSSISSGVVVIVRLLLVSARRIRVLLLLLLRVLMAVTAVVRSWVGISVGKTA